jgi:hypothetical protein
MANLSGFDANNVEPSRGFEPIPAGKYLAVIIESEMQANKAGNGHFLLLIFEVIEGPHKGSHLWVRLNLDHPNPKAVEMAQADLSSICRAVSVLAPGDSVELHNLPLVVLVKVKKRDDNGDLVNEIRGYYKKESLTPPPGHTPPPASSPPPWKRS